MTTVMLKLPQVSDLQEIVTVLLEARSSVDYNIGGPLALDHLLTHVVAALQDIDIRLKVLERDYARKP